MLVIERAIGLAKLGMSLAGNVSQMVIDHGGGQWFEQSLSILKIPPGSLVALDGLEQRLEVPFAEGVGTFALDDFKKERGTVFHRPGEDLQQVAFLVAVDQNLQAPQQIVVFAHLSDTAPNQIII